MKAVADVFAPVNCEVFQVNTKLSDTPELLNKQPYQDGWIAIVGVINLDAEKNDLLNAPSYADYLRSQIHK